MHFSPYVLQVIVGQGFIVTGALAEQTRHCAQLVSSAPVEHQSPCPVLQGHIALEQETHTRTTAPPVPPDTTVKVSSNVFFSTKYKTCFHKIFNKGDSYG